MEKVKRCKQCGELKPESQFRPYYGRGEAKGTRSQSRYKVCITCEKINTRFKYLRKKYEERPLSEVEAIEYQKIDKLYRILLQRGFEPPGSKDEEPVDIDAEIERHTSELQRIRNYGIPTGAPPELVRWLDEDLTRYTPEHLQDVIADQLLKEFRPQLQLDNQLNPVYDNKYRDVLNLILKRFDDYEDQYED